MTTAQPAGGVFRYRELLGNLVRRELKVKYKNSALGFLWSLLNPALYLTIFGIALGVFLRVGVPWFVYFLLCGLLPFNFMSTAIVASTRSFLDNANLISKVWFPRQVLPLAPVGAAFVHFGLQLAILLAALLVTGYARFWDAGLILLPAAIVVEIALIASIGTILACLNVRYRDVQHLVEVAMLAWMWMTPIVYPIATVSGRIGQAPVLWWLYLANPMTAIVLATQRALYVHRIAPGGIAVLVDEPLAWYAKRLGYAAVLALVLGLAAVAIFRRFEPKLAEEV